MAAGARKIFEEGGQPGAEPFIRRAGDDLTRPATPEERRRSQTVAEASAQPTSDREFLLQELRAEADPAVQDQIMDAIDRMDNEERETAIRAQTAAELEQKRAEQPPKEPSLSERIIGGGLRNVGAAVEIAATFGSGALAEPVAGLAGILAAIVTQDSNKAADVVNDVRDAMTLDPTSARGKTALRSVAAPLVALDEAAMTISSAGDRFNPYASTLIYTTIVGGTSFLGVKGGGRLKSTKKAKEVQKLADELGVDLTEVGLAESIVARAAEIVPSERAANAPALRQALIKEREVQAARQEGLRVEAQRHNQTITDISAVPELGVELRTQLLNEGFDLDGMPIVTDALDALDNFVDLVPGDKTVPRAGVTETSTPLAQLLELDTIRDRLEAGQRQVKDNPSNPRGVRQKLALQELDKQIEGWVQKQFVDDMITGTPEQMAKWKQYNDSRSRFNKTFNEDKAIQKLMDREATPEEMSRFLIGASAASSKPVAAATIRRLKSVLGDDHPTIQGIRADYLHEIAAPLFEADPNFTQFLKNYERAIAKNPSLVKELGLKTGPLSQLRQFARVAETLNPKAKLRLINDMPTAISRFLFGHGIARAGQRVSVLGNMVKLMFGSNTLTRKAIISDIVGNEFGAPAITKSGLAAGRFVQAAFLTDITGAQEDVESKQ